MPLEGARQGAPQAIKVADRFHLWQNLGQAVKRPSMPTAPTSASPLPNRPARPRRRCGSQTRRRKSWPACARTTPAVQHLHAQGLPKTVIGRKLGMHPATVRKFATARNPEDLIAKTEQRTHVVDPWTGHLHQCWHEGERNATQLFREIRRPGYPGGELAVQRYLHRFRQGRGHAPQPGPKPPTVRQVTSWIMTYPDHLDRRDAAKLRGIRDRDSDLDAVHRGLSLTHSSGPVEGSINRLKMLKRQMFGRASMDLLGKRVLLTHRQLRAHMAAVNVQISLPTPITMPSVSTFSRRARSSNTPPAERRPPASLICSGPCIFERTTRPIDRPVPGRPGRLPRGCLHRGCGGGNYRACATRAGAATVDCLLPRVHATLAALSEPGSVQTMRSLAAYSPALKAARAITGPAISYPSVTAGERRPGQPPDAGRCALCIYCRTDRFSYWPPAIRLSMAGYPGCQPREAAGRNIAPLNERPAAALSRTTPTARSPRNRRLALTLTGFQYHPAPGRCRCARRSRPWRHGPA